MLGHILVPLDGSSLAECVLPHVILFAKVFGCKVTVLQALEQSHDIEKDRVIDPLNWLIHKNKAEMYLAGIVSQLQKTGIEAESQIVEGQAAEGIINFAQRKEVDLIALSSHGLSGISGWNVSSVVQKVMLCSYKSILLIRAYQSEANRENRNFRYNRILLPLDGSRRAEYAFPLAINLARNLKAQLLLTQVVVQPEMPRQVPLTQEDTELSKRIVDRNRSVAVQYLEHLKAQLSDRKVDVQCRLMVGEHPISILHNLICTEKVDLMLLVAHGHTGDLKWPFGSVTTSFIAYGTSTLLILQDMGKDEFQERIAMLQIKAPERIH